MLLPLKIALRFLLSSKTQTVMIILGIAVGIAAQVFVGTLIISLQQTIVNSTIGSSSHITVVPAEDGMMLTDWQGMITDIEDGADVKHVCAAGDANALVNTQGNRTFPALLRGLQLDRAEGIYKLSDRLKEGREPGKGEVLAGADNREEYGLKLGDTLSVVLPNGSLRTVTISGFFDFEVAAVNQGWLITTLATVQDLFGWGTGASSIEMQVDDVFAADAIAKDVEKALDSPDVEVKNWKDENAQLLSGLQAQSSSSYMIQFFVVASVVIAIASILAITVMQKSRQIGILKAMGITDIKASLVFFFQGAIMGLIGGFLGVLLGLGLFAGFLFGVGVVDPYVSWPFVFGSWGVAFLAAAGASLIPARKSLKLDPIEVIRNG